MIDDQSAHNAPDDEGKAPGPDADPATDTDAVWAAPSLEVIAEAAAQMRRIAEEAAAPPDGPSIVTAGYGLEAAQVDAIAAIVLTLREIRETIAAGLRVFLSQTSPEVNAALAIPRAAGHDYPVPALERLEPQTTPPAEVHQAIAALVRLIEDREPETYTVAKTAGTPPTQSGRQIVKTTILQEHELLAVRSAICTLADWIGAAPPEQG